MRPTTYEFRDLVGRHRRMVFSIALRITGDQSTAEEVTQDVFWELVKAVATLKDEDHARFWLRRVSVHRSTDALRKRQRQPEVQAEEWFEEEHASAENVALPTALGMRIDDLLGTLPEAMRVIVVLRYQEDLTPGEIAEVLGQPLQTVKSTLKRGLELMRRKAQVTLREYIR